MAGQTNGSATQTMSPIPSQDLDQIWEWNKEVPIGIDSCVHDIIYERTQLNPSAPAICAWDGKLTYAELDRLASGLGSRLISLGASHGTIIPLCFEKSLFTTVAVLGVLKAGAAFVLLDPSIPKQRLRTIFAQTGAQLVVTSTSNENLGKNLASQVVVIGHHNVEQLNTLEPQEAPVPPTPSSTMYLVFTSGSTGTPKGTILTHRNLASALYHQRDNLNITSNTRMYDFCSYSFDVFVCNTFATLSVGGCLCVPNELDRQNKLAESIASLNANTIDLTPSVSRLLRPEQVPSLQQIIFGGEALRVEDVIPWWDKVRIVSLYGPCECTPNSTIISSPASPTEATTMGKGIGLNTWITSVDDHDQLVPLGAVGELLLEGPLVGQGYLNDISKTTAAFVENPSWLTKGASARPGRNGRLYKTGDLVTYTSDGSLRFVSRKDEQIKIRGQRVELGEIEHVMRSHESVKDAVVILKYEQGQDPWIAGFITRQNHLYPASAEESKNAEHTDGWESRFDDDYLTLAAMHPESVGRDFEGWTSMYDGKDIDKGEMNEWLDDTIASILNGKSPGHVLEIGTGSGMILFSLLSGLESYHGIEPSARAVDFVTQATKALPGLSDKVTMHKGTAADLDRFASNISPNLVILNSVIQYFPSETYLLNVVQDLVQLKGVETIFFGDVRSLTLYDEFLAARTLHVTDAKASKREFRRIMEDMRRAEAELLVDPKFFTQLVDKIENVEHVEILPKKVRATNELSSFRYEAVVHVRAKNEGASKVHQVHESAWIDFQRGRLTRVPLVELLKSKVSTSTVVAVSNIPHSKSSHMSHVVTSLSDKTDSQDHANWLSAPRDDVSMSAVDLVDVAREAGYRVELSWARQRGGIDAIFHHQESSNDKGRVLFKFPTDGIHKPLCNHPLQRQIQPELNQILKSQLPSYMVPGTITILDKIPLNDNGKVDRRALETSIPSRFQGRTADEEPVSEAEGHIRDMWGEVLNIEPAKIGLGDSFFQIGGDSITAMELVGRARKAGVTLTVRHLLQHPKLQDLVRAVV